MTSPHTVGELALQVLHHRADDFLEHAPGAASGDDPRAVHQTRVATRRLRAALRLFRDVLPAQATSLHDDLAWIAAELGPARDLDVQVHRLRQSAVELGVLQPLAPYGAWLEAQRQRAQRELDAAMKSVRFQNLTRQLHSLRDWLPNPATDAPIDKEGPRRLRRVYRKLKNAADRIGPDSPVSALHQVRIRAKRLRYAAEFFAVVYGKPAERLVAHVISFQDLLGDLQDGVVCGQHIHQAVQTAAGAWPAETSLALGQLLQHDVQRGASVRERFPSAYKDVRDRGWKRLVSDVAMV